MQFCEIAQELKPLLEPTSTNSDFVLSLVGQLLRDPIDEDEQKLYDRGCYNPLSTVEPNTRNVYYSGTRPISKIKAEVIFNRFDAHSFVETIDDLPDAGKEHLQKFLRARGVDVELVDLGVAMEDIFRQLFNSLWQGNPDPEIALTIYDPKPSVRSSVENRVYCEDGKLFIDGSVIELPVKLSADELYEFESGYISALCAAYADALSLDSVEEKDIPSLPVKYRRDYSRQRKAYLSAESIQRSMREVYDEGENQFDILKADAYDGIQTTYFGDYENGYGRLVSVLNKVSDIQLTKSKLMLIKNLIGNLERLGIVHILVNDGTIKSWVDPYEE